MRKIFTLVLLVAGGLFLPGKVTAQGNLQFNQVVNLTLTAGTGYAFTVPANKVWKIESCGGDNTNGYTIYLRNTSNQILQPLASSSTAPPNNLPCWLGSGFTGNFLFSTFGTPKGHVSIIEFNVVP